MTDTITTTEPTVNPTPGTVASVSIWVEVERLVLGPNRETNLDLVPGLAESLARFGNFQSVLAMERSDGNYDVIDGAHRVSAAREQDVACLKVEVLGAEQGKLARLQLQFNTGEHARKLSDTDKIYFVGEMLDLGVDYDEIAARYAIELAEAKRIGRVARSARARATVDNGLDLMQASIVDEYAEAGRPEVAESLVAAAAEGRFDRQLRITQRKDEVAAEFEEQAKPYRDRGFRIIDTEPAYNSTEYWRLWSLRTKKGKQVQEKFITDSNASAFAVYFEQGEAYCRVSDGERLGQYQIDFETRWSPQFAATEDRVHFDDIEVKLVYRPVFYCHDLEAAGLVPGSSSDTASATSSDEDEAAQRAAAKAARQLVIKTNQAAREETAERRGWLTKELQKWMNPDKEIPAGLRRFAATRTAADPESLSKYHGRKLAQEWLGTTDLVTLADTLPEDRAFVISLVLAVGALEAMMVTNNDPKYWRYNPAEKRSQFDYLRDCVDYLRLLGKLGHELSPLELVMLGKLTHAEAMEVPE
ncbi:ParB N-terminal domain-containing protein [Nocardia sp. NPDC060249]|uniref:ParB N-terminal domain-containing protein n=1 Tax=Nocardia sp. NPDC060249 TaxID=3347082 RepID=UPI003661621B